MERNTHTHTQKVMEQPWVGETTFFYLPAYRRRETPALGTHVASKHLVHCRRETPALSTHCPDDGRALSGRATPAQCASDGLGSELVTTHIEVLDSDGVDPDDSTCCVFPRWKGRCGWLLDSGSSCDLAQHDSIPELPTINTDAQPTALCALILPLSLMLILYNSVFSLTS